MAHFAELDENNIVVNVLVVNNEDTVDANGDESESVGIAFLQNLFGQDKKYKQTSYNANFRKNYAGIGYTYDTVNDVFYEPQPFASWTISEETNWIWTPPVPYPDDEENQYNWDEETTSWVEV